MKTFFIDKFGSCNKNNFIIPHAILIYNSFLETTENKRSSEKKPIIRFCHSGNLSIERNPFNFLHAISKFIQETANENFRVDIIGKCDSSIDEIIKTLNLDKCVTVIGPLSYQETINQLANYDGFILLEAIMIEGIYLPSKISDYILFNKPIICISPDQGVIADLSKTCKQLFFASNLNVEEIKESITKVFNLLRAKSTPCIKESYINEKMLLNNSIVDTLTKITRS